MKDQTQKALNQFEVSQICDHILLENDIDPHYYTLYLLSNDNKDKLKYMIKTKIKNEYQGIDYFLLFYDLRNTAHWCAMVINYTHQYAYFYCSYGIFMDTQYNYSKSKIIDSDLVKSLLKSLYRLGYEVHYNNQQLQSVHTNVCGRYCGVFLAFNMIDVINPDEFNDWIIKCSNQDDVSYDVFITNFTNYI